MCVAAHRRLLSRRGCNALQFVKNTRAFSILGATLAGRGNGSTDSAYVNGHLENHFSDPNILRSQQVRFARGQAVQERAAGCPAGRKTQAAARRAFSLCAYEGGFVGSALSPSRTVTH